MILKIKKGRHYSLSHFFKRMLSIFDNKTRSFDFELFSNCWFEKIEEDDYDINKLLGYSYGYHHRNSIRLGWVPSSVENEFEIYLYRYEKGFRSFNYLMNVKANEWNNVLFTEDFKNNRLIVELKSIDEDHDKRSIMKSYSHNYPKFRLGYSLWFYFGGNKTAPKNMVCDIIKKF